MKRTIAYLTLLLVTVVVTAVPGAEKHINATLVTMGGSGVTGKVELTQMPHGGSLIHVTAHGLHPGSVYASFYYGSNDCSAAHDLLGSFTADAEGVGSVTKKIDDDLDEVGSVSVRVGPDYGDLLACATVH